MKKEILITGIICLFIGLGIQPAFAIEISNFSPSEDIEDCNCEVADNYNIVKVKSLLNRAERSLNRVETLTKLIPVLFKDNPKLIEDFKEISEKITTFRVMKEELNSAISGRDYPIICTILENIYLLLDLLIWDIWDLINMFEDTNPYLSSLIWIFILVPIVFLGSCVDVRIEKYGCDFPFQGRNIRINKINKIMH